MSASILARIERSSPKDRPANKQEMHIDRQRDRHGCFRLVFSARFGGTVSVDLENGTVRYLREAVQDDIYLPTRYKGSRIATSHASLLVTVRMHLPTYLPRCLSLCRVWIVATVTQTCRGYAASADAVSVSPGVTL